MLRIIVLFITNDTSFSDFRFERIFAAITTTSKKTIIHSAEREEMSK